MKSIDTSTQAPVFELKGSVLTVLVLHIRETDADSLYPQLEKKIGQARSFFSSAPILIDLSAVDEEGQAALDFMFLADTLRKLGVVPVGVRGGASCHGERILQAGLGLLPAVKTERTVATSVEAQSSEPEIWLFSLRSMPGRKSLPQGTSMFMGPCAAGLWLVSMVMSMPGSSACSATRSWLPSRGNTW